MLLFVLKVAFDHPNDMNVILSFLVMYYSLRALVPLQPYEEKYLGGLRKREKAKTRDVLGTSSGDKQIIIICTVER